MNIASEYDCRILNSCDIESYQQLTYPTYRDRLKHLAAGTLAIGVARKLTPIGLVLAEYSAVDKSAKILSLFTVPEYRNQGIGTNLLSSIEQLVVKHGCTEISLVYTTNPSTPHLERILAQGKWSTPETRLLMAHSNCIRADNEALVEYVRDILRRTPLPNGFTICPWDLVTATELTQIKHDEDTWYPKALSPCTEIEKIEHSNSLGLRYHGEIVGWVITHRSTPDMIRYTSLFVRDDLQRVGKAIPPLTLLFESFLLQAQHNQVANASFVVADNNNKMLRIVNRRIGSFLSSAKYSMGTHKSL
jgi:GNAT superfamily N-acetyltransferase